MPLRPGELFGRYQLAEILGRGGMGEVYSAYDTVLHRKVALKVLTVQPAGAPATPLADTEHAGKSSTGGAARILREARAAAGIAHPNAVSIYDVGEFEGVSFLAMELVSGRTLRAFVGDASIPLARRLRWIVDVARALGAAHKLNLIHRDIKPENVMVRDDGFVKVLDFGIARRTVTKEEAVRLDPKDLAALASFGHTSGTLTAEGMVLGTPMYMAPEQMLGDALDGRTDEFAWAVLAYEVLIGERPWKGDGSQIVSEILSKEVEPLGERLPEIPARVDAAIRKAMSKAPGARFATMEEAAEELEPFAASGTGANRVQPTSARDPAFAPTEQVPVSTSGAISKKGSGSAQATTVRERKRVGVATIGIVGVVVAGAVAGGRAIVGRRGDVATVVDAAPVDVPSQMSSNPDATAAYRAGLQALRDAAFGAALKQLGRAVELDPLFAAAHLRLAISKLLSNYATMITSADLVGARTSQAYLGTRDRILLEAFGHLTEELPDFAASERALADGVARFPNDADLPFQRALVLDLAQRQADAKNAIEASLAIDPGFAFGWRMKGRILTELDDVPGSASALAKCLDVSPGATACLMDIASIDANDGRCEDLVRASRKLEALLPDVAEPYEWLAQGLVGSGEPVEAVRAAMQQAWDHKPVDKRAFAEVEAEAALAVLAGDFGDADQRYQRLEKATTSSSDASQVFWLTYPRVLLDVETGRFAEATRLAEAFLHRQPGLRADEVAGAYDYSLQMQIAELEAGGIARAKFDILRSAWFQRNATDPTVDWVTAYALPTQTKEDAIQAVALKPSTPVSVLIRSSDLGEPIGHTLWLGGRLDEGIVYLTGAAKSCDILNGVRAIFSTWASFELGAALDERHDVAGACAAYGRVLSRWGSARPASRTAFKALAQSRALRCEENK